MHKATLFLSLLGLFGFACDAADDGDGDGTSGGSTGTVSTASSEASSTTASTEPGSTTSATTQGSGPTGGSSDGSETSATDSTTGSTSSADEESTGCGNLDDDPNNCGDCDNVCEAPSNGAATCQAGGCGAECNSGYDDVDLGDQTRCSKFAGFFLLRETGVCEAENPFTGDCTCPSGFDDRPVTSWRIEPNDGQSWVQLAVCSPVAEDAEDAWGGLFAQYEDGGSCAFPNPLNIPLCACPAGHTVTSQWRGSNINADAIVISFCSEGAYEDDALFVGGFTDACGAGCAAGSCECPEGSVRVDYPSVIPGCSTQSAFCYRP